jgi:hypothetical protein
MPSQPRSAIFLMNARRAGVSTSCAKFSRVWVHDLGRIVLLEELVDFFEKRLLFAGKIEVHRGWSPRPGPLTRAPI